MRTKMEVASPADVEVTMSLTMTLGDWAKLRAQLAKEWPSWELSRAISDMTYKMQKTVYPDASDA